MLLMWVIIIIFHTNDITIAFTHQSIDCPLSCIVFLPHEITHCNIMQQLVCNASNALPLSRIGRPLFISIAVHWAILFERMPIIFYRPKSNGVGPYVWPNWKPSCMLNNGKVQRERKRGEKKTQLNKTKQNNMLSIVVIYKYAHFTLFTTDFWPKHTHTHCCPFWFAIWIDNPNSSHCSVHMSKTRPII